MRHLCPPMRRGRAHRCKSIFGRTQAVFTGSTGEYGEKRKGGGYWTGSPSILTEEQAEKQRVSPLRLLSLV